MIPFIDIHTHQKQSASDVHAIRNFSQLEWSSTVQSQRIPVERIPLREEGEHFPFLNENERASAGLHPWYLTRENYHEDFGKLQQIIDNQKLVAIGECGLDKLRGVDLTFQIPVFEAQIRLADRVGKPVIVHVVRAFNELIAVKKRVKPTVPMIVHGFTKNEQILDSLLRNGFFISIGAAILRGSNGAFKTPQNDQSGFENRVLKIPLNRLFFETDTATVPIQTIYEAYAQLKGIGLEELKAIIFDQHARLY